METNEELASWAVFLNAFEKGLDVLAKRIEKTRQKPGEAPCPVLFTDNHDEATTPDEFLIGSGYWARRVEQSGKDISGDQALLVPVNHNGIFLNNKGAEFVLSQRPASVTELVLSDETSFFPVWSKWKSVLADDVAPASFFQRFTLVVEDASPDSCFALIVFLARMNGLAPSAIPRHLVEYITHWEQGDVSTTGDPFSSWAALHSALSHSYVGVEEKPAATSASGADQEFSFRMSEAWLRCLRLDLDVLRSGCPPFALADYSGSTYLLEAKAFLGYEYQQYLQGLDHAIHLQLLLPMIGGGNRYKLVDAYLEEEFVPCGSIKVFLRNDHEHTWLKDGFSLMAIHRQDLAGTGNDMVISVDPSAGVQLSTLWCELERLEDEAWAGTRPNDNPRIGILGYPGGQRPGVDGGASPNQPWYDGGNYTLIAAPKSESGDLPGTRLGWMEVTEAIWRNYYPARFLKIVDINGELCHPHDCGAVVIGGLPAKSSSGKDIPHLRVARWPENIDGLHGVRLSPTLKRYLAACVTRQAETTGLMPLSYLPALDSFDFLRMQGGLAIIHRLGVFLLDDWRSQKLDVRALQIEFRKAAEKWTKIDETERGIEDLLKAVRSEWQTRKLHRRTPLKLLDLLTEYKMDIRSAIMDTRSTSTDAEVLDFRAVLEKRWGIEARLEQAYDMLNKFENTLRSYTELLTNWLIAVLTIFGFPALFFAGFFDFIIRDEPLDKLGVVPGGGAEHIVNWEGLLLYCVLTTLGMLILWLAVRIMRIRGSGRLIKQHKWLRDKAP
jgi:hypothetical protein